MNAISSLLKRMRGGPGMSESMLAHNLSYVLHERSDSASVRRAARASMRADDVVRRLPSSASCPVVISVTDAPSPAWPTVWLTPTIGAAHLLGAAIERQLAVQPTIVVIDDSSADALQEQRFFRAPATLSLPALSGAAISVGVAALVIRPDGRTTHLVVSGTFRWPDDSDLAVRALERLIQSFADQWRPARHLWQVPAEWALGDEIR